MEQNNKIETPTPFSQKEAVYLNTLNVLELDGEKLRTLEKPLRELLTKSVQKQVRQKLFEGFKRKSISLKSEKTDSELKKYCSNVLKNWIARDSRFD